MTKKFSTNEWASFVDQHKAGKTVRQIINENPEIKKSSFQYHLNKDKSKSISKSKSEPEPEPEHSPAPKSAKVDGQPDSPEPSIVPIKDTFLQEFSPQAFRPKPPPKPMGGLVDSVFSLDDVFQPEMLATPQKVMQVPKPSSNPLGKSKSWWLSSKTNEQNDQTKSDNEQLVLVQKIRLYFVHFPELGGLHIVPKKKASDEPDIEKWLISLYAKKVPELQKTLNFVRFHVRNNISENSSIKLASNVLETTVKVLEHTLMLIGVQAQNLTKDVMQDEDITRCLKEILIDNSINSLNLGPKSDLCLKLGMKIVAADSQNRIERRLVEAQMPLVKPKDRIPEKLLNKYAEL